MSTDKTLPKDVLVPERSNFRGMGDPYRSYQEKRRHNALQRQKAARLHSSNRARKLALEQSQEDDGSEDCLSGGSGLLEGVALGPREDATVVDAEMDPSTSYGTGGHAARRGAQGGRGRSPRGSGCRRPSGHVNGNGGVRAYGQRYGSELMQPEWMTDIPSGLATDWLVMPRPEGMRCLLVTSRGRTVSWLRNGAPLHRFYSALPGGSPATTVGCGGSATAAAASGDYCLLDCIFHPPNNTYYVQDLLCWRGYALYDTAAEFRTFWLFSKFQEEGLLQLPRVEPCDAGDGVNGAREGVAGNMDTDMGRCSSSGNADGADDDSNGGRCGSQGSHRHCASESYRIVPLPVRPCTLQGLRAAYGRVPPPPAAGGVAQTSGTDPWVTGHEGAVGLESDVELEVDFLRDGLYFLHRHGHYHPGLGTSPLALLWKDLGCSRYLLDTDSGGQPLEHQAVTLTYRADRTVATEDDPPVVLGKLPEAFSTAMGDKLKPGRLLRFSIRQGGIIFHEGRPAGADLHYEGPANQRRGRADSFSKVLFQRLARTAPITVSMLAAAVAASESAAGGDGSLEQAVAGTGLVCGGHGLAMDMASMALE
ncbi:hypothetical protein Vafri_5078 [Volvox africanus]|uniref:Snurportin-1 n=1 Tax=Volvox africanus TaxID=51714 RepID=A0A8J4EY35_9CHLO|nr:hypothetical protein Vafri_5078 [Volvox africanus]